MTTPKIGLISGSTRTGSLNIALTKAMAFEFKSVGATPSFIDLKKYEMPIYDGGWEAENGIPKSAKTLIQRMKTCDGIFIATPEYNGCLPALLKNTIDWTTRIGLDHFSGQIFGIGAATPGGLSGIMALKQLHFILARLGACVVPRQLGVGAAYQAFDKKGRLLPGRQADFAQTLVSQMMTEISYRRDN